MEIDAVNDLPRWPFRYDQQKGLEALLFVIKNLNEPTLHSVSKIFYHADREHISRFGRPISGDQYVAMKHGPVPSKTYDMMKYVRGDGTFSVSEKVKAAFEVVNARNLVALRDPNLQILSQSEMECLKQAIDEHGKKSFKTLTNESHDAAWDSADENDLIALKGFLLTIDNHAELIEHFLNDGS